MIDHTGVGVTDIGKSKAFCNAAVAPISYAPIMAFPVAASESGENGKRDAWIRDGGASTPPIQVA